ncbi:outer membrane lipoprotein carrier protein LolA [Formosa agariphila KMM 3901]|uniref:Outer membrane lipoprotein carrier protein LolA n=1 Tax=Formosa agariphila (strain DSM 15362 / KCTC 12365 / LMG 23005 / KMM 3901 / M-2Alg 35-1) TaxID=1347342 RepID=T2KMN5_FORAG|nr:outer membrane lipoprotein carrier protein LolA [Formosa agariphila]CDF80157.1 outer membrane lipoprotein carrier protein LolA [Formosa agariphila KMM 3901]
MKTFLLSLTLCFTLLGFSQNDAKAKALLDQVSQKVKSYDNISLDFKYVLHNAAENINQETRGDVIMSGDKYVLNILGVTRIFDGKTLYSINPEDEEVTISQENPEDAGSITPSKMLSFYNEGYTYKMGEKQNIKGRDIQFVKLTPMDSNSEIKHVLLGIDPQTKHIYNLIEVGQNGTQTTLTVSSFETNQTLSKALFSFDENKYKSYYINTLN